MHATNRALFQTARNAVKPELLHDFPHVSYSNYFHLRGDIGLASAFRKGGPAICKTAANGKDQSSAGEQNATAWGAMIPGSGASGSMAFAGELAPSPKPLPQATARDSAGSAVTGARRVARSETQSMRALA